jgi:hypothetical protein
MAGNKYLKLSSGELAEEAATQTSAGAGDAGKIPALDSSGRLDTTMMPVGIGADTGSIPASENLSAGDLVNVYAANSTTVNCRKADASGGLAKRCHGFVLSAVTAPASALVYFEGTITGLSGLTIGSAYYLTATAGTSNTSGATAAGHILQNIGVATSNSTISFEPQSPVVLA